MRLTIAFLLTAAAAFAQNGGFSRVDLTPPTGAGLVALLQIHDKSNPQLISSSIYSSISTGTVITSGSKYIGSGGGFVAQDTQAFEVVIPDATGIHLYWDSLLTVGSGYPPTQFALWSPTQLQMTGEIIAQEYVSQTDPAFKVLDHLGNALMLVNTDGSVILGKGTTFTSPALYLENSANDTWQIQAFNSGSQSFLQFNQIIALNPEVDFDATTTVSVKKKLLVGVEEDLGTTIPWAFTISTLSSGPGCTSSACDTLLVVPTGASTPVLDINAGLYVQGGATYLAGNLEVAGSTITLDEFSGGANAGVLCTNTSGVVVADSSGTHYPCGVVYTSLTQSIGGNKTFTNPTVISNTLNVGSTFSLGAGTHIVYTCNTAGAVLPAGALTTVSADCGAANDTTMRIP
jgi:hypothetical protein